MKYSIFLSLLKEIFRRINFLWKFIFDAGAGKKTLFMVIDFIKLVLELLYMYWMINSDGKIEISKPSKFK